MNKISSASDYRFGSEKPHTNAYLSGPVVSYLKSINAQRVLELGCGNGVLASDLAGEGIAVVGIDPSESGVKNCRQLVPEGKFYCASIYDDPHSIPESEFDAAISTEVIEHLFYPRELPKFARAKLKSRAPLLITTPYHGYLKNVALAAMNKWDFHHTPLWDGGHIKFWSQATISELLEECGFAVEKFVGCGRFAYFWKSMLIIARQRGD